MWNIEHRTRPVPRLTIVSMKILNILQKPYIRYGELKHNVPHISHKGLSHELKCLEMDKLIERIPYPVIPPRVEYLATAKGESLRHVMVDLCDWAKNL